MTDIRSRRWAGIKETADAGPLRRSSIYELGAEHPGLLRKWRGRTLVDLDLYDRILSDLPSAKVKSARKVAATAPEQGAA